MMKANLGSLNGTQSGFFQAVFCLTLLPDMSAKRLFCASVNMCVCLCVSCKFCLHIRACVCVCVCGNSPIT